MLIFASRCCLAAAVGLLLAAGMLLIPINQSKANKLLTIESPTRHLGDQPAGEHTIAFLIRNMADEPKRIIGMVPG